MTTYVLTSCSIEVTPAVSSLNNAGLLYSAYYQDSINTTLTNNQTGFPAVSFLEL